MKKKMVQKFPYLKNRQYRKKEKKNRGEKITNKIIQENFTELKNMRCLIEKAHWLSRTMDENRPTPKHILVKFQNTGTQRRSYKFLEREKKMTHKGSGIRMASDCSMLILKARRQKTNTLEILQLEFFTKPNYNLSVRVE